MANAPTVVQADKLSIIDDSKLGISYRLDVDGNVFTLPADDTFVLWYDAEGNKGGGYRGDVGRGYTNANVFYFAVESDFVIGVNLDEVEDHEEFYQVIDPT